jgi:lipopolysaccharide transport periplasmic protein LptA
VDRSSRPITIKADELKADNKGKIATFTGRVVARQEDVTIYSDKLVIYYGDKQDQVDKIEAIGSVRILQTNRIGTGGHALYESREGKITLSGNPKVTQDKDSITGQVIVYYLDDDRSVGYRRRKRQG